MADDSLESTAQYEAAYRGGRSAELSVLSGALWAFLGVVGVGLFWLTAIALTNGTASLARFLFALFRAVTTVLGGDELYHRLLGGTPIF